MFKVRIKKLQESISKSHALLVTNKSNIAYLTGFTGSSGFLLVSKLKTKFFTDSRYIERAKYTVPKFIELSDITRLWKNEKLLKDSWQKSLKSLHIKTIDFDANNLTINQFKKFKKISPKIKFKESLPLIENLRSQKDETEISLIKRSQAINEKTFLMIKKVIQHGLAKNKPIKEIDLVWEIKRLGYQNGAEDISFEPIVAFGKNSSMPHHKSGDTKLKKGDVVLIDMGMKYKGYCSDMTRVIFTKVPTKEQKQVFETVLQAHKNALQKTKPGLVEQKIDSLAREHITEKGYGENFGHGTGHGVGLDIHESPNLSEKGKQKIKKNMVITIEPGVYLEGKFGVRIENMALVTKTGLKNLTSLPYWQIIK